MFSLLATWCFLMALALNAGYTARFMDHFAEVVQAIKDDIPQHARPVAQELLALVDTALSKAKKYALRATASRVILERRDTVCYKHL